MCFRGATSQCAQSADRLGAQAMPFRVKNTFVDVTPVNTPIKDSQKVGGMRRLRSEPALNLSCSDMEPNKASAGICLDDDVDFDSDNEVWGRLVTGDCFEPPYSPSSDETTTQCSTGGPSEAEIESLVAENGSQPQQPGYPMAMVAVPMQMMSGPGIMVDNGHQFWWNADGLPMPGAGVPEATFNADACPDANASDAARTAAAPPTPNDNYEGEYSAQAMQQRRRRKGLGSLIDIAKARQQGEGEQPSAGPSATGLNFCPFCGGKVKAAFKFCSYCGGALPNKAA